jgi:AcrR family transcriptional regulator
MVQLREALREERATEKKREILEAASRVFRRKGPHTGGMRDIAAGLEMAVGNLYYYLQDKEDLLAPARKDAMSDALTALYLRFNGETRTRVFPTHHTLVEVLREEFGLAGTKHGCEFGKCGTCAVLVAGQPVLSCLALAAETEGHEIETVEGLQTRSSSPGNSEGFAAPSLDRLPVEAEHLPGKTL